MKRLQTNMVMTRREIEIYDFMAAGMSADEIAIDLSITESGVKHHQSNIFRKTECHNRFKFICRHYAMILENISI